MRKVTEIKVFNVFRFEELSQEVKEKVMEDYLHDDYYRVYAFSEGINRQLKELKNSNLQVEYSLNYCQGDGLNVYGTLNVGDVLNNREWFDRIGADIKLTDNTVKLLQCIKDYDIELRENMRYGYCMVDMSNIEYQILDMIEEELEIDIPVVNGKTVVTNKTVLAGLCFAKYVIETMCKYCKQYEEEGYKYFYDIDYNKEEIEAWAENYEFYGDGKIYA